MKSKTRAAAVAIFVCLLAGCTDPVPTGEAQEGRVQFIEEIQALFDQRARQLSAGRLDGYLKPLEPEARAAEEPIARAFLSLPATAPSFVIQKSSIKTSGLPAGGVVARFQYRYQGLAADNSFSFPITYRLVSKQGTIRIAEAKPGPGELPMWASGPVQTHRSSHFLAFSRPGVDEVERILAVAEAANTALQPLLPVPQDARSLIVLASDGADFERLIASAGSGGAERVAQVSTTLQITPDEVSVRGRHIVVNLNQLAEDETGPETFRHELAHLALAPLTRPTTPGWIAEGAAMYLAGTRPAKAWAAGLREGSYQGIELSRLSEAADLGGHGLSGSVSSEYAYAAAAAWYLVETYGKHRFWQLYSAFAGSPPKQLYDLLPVTGGDNRAGQLGASITKQALDSLYGVTPEELDVAVRSWMANQSG